MKIEIIIESDEPSKNHYHGKPTRFNCYGNDAPVKAARLLIDQYQIAMEEIYIRNPFTKEKNDNTITQREPHHTTT